jgi:hypothetical protein
MIISINFKKFFANSRARTYSHRSIYIEAEGIKYSKRQRYVRYAWIKKVLDGKGLSLNFEHQSVELRQCIRHANILKELSL